MSATGTTLRGWTFWRFGRRFVVGRHIRNRWTIAHLDLAKRGPVWGVYAFRGEDGELHILAGLWPVVVELLVEA